MKVNKSRETSEILELARETFDLEDGKLYQKKARSGVRVGERAGSINKSRGYREVSLDGRSYKEHRLIYSMHHNRWPVAQIDHRDGVRDNNRIENLREVTQAENLRAFCKPKSGASSQYRGVCFCKTNKKWMASIGKDGTQYNLGRFSNETAAALAYNAAAKRMGFFKEALNIIPETDQ